MNTNPTPPVWVIIKDGRVIATHDEPCHLDGVQGIEYRAVTAPATAEELMRAIDAYAYDYGRMAVPKLAPSRFAVERALTAALSSASAQSIKDAATIADLTLRLNQADAQHKGLARIIASTRAVPNAEGALKNIELIEAVGFECQAGALEWSVPWRALKRFVQSAAQAAPAGATLIFPSPIDIAAAMTERAKTRTSGENIADVLFALAAAGMRNTASTPPPQPEAQAAPASTAEGVVGEPTYTAGAIRAAMKRAHIWQEAADVAMRHLRDAHPAAPPQPAPAAQGLTDAEIESEVACAFESTNDSAALPLHKYWFRKGLARGADAVLAAQKD